MNLGASSTSKTNLVNTYDAGQRGCVVWHDLHTPDVGGAKTFYTRLVGWRFVEECATDFAWADGPGIYILAMDGDEAGAGIVARPELGTAFWLAYVEVEDVDAAVARAAAAGGRIVKEPFNVRGVGRNAVVADPRGARIGVAVSAHGFPRPTRQFGLERYAFAAGQFPAGFYRAVIGWMPVDDASVDQQGEVVAIIEEAAPQEPEAVWLPTLRVPEPARLEPAHSAGKRCDPSGAVFAVEEP